MSTARGRSANDGLARLAHLVAEAMHRRMRGNGVVPDGLSVMLALWSEDGLTEGDLTKRIGASRKAVTSTLEILERDHMIRRRSAGPGGADSVLVLSRRAKVVESMLADAAGEVLGTATRGLGAEETRQLAALVDRMVENLERETARR